MNTPRTPAVPSVTTATIITHGVFSEKAAETDSFFNPSCTVSYTEAYVTKVKARMPRAPRAPAAFFFDSTIEALQTMKDDGYELQTRRAHMGCDVFFFTRFSVMHECNRKETPQ